MLMEISSLITPEVYDVIYRMGHLGELVIADGNYLATAMSPRVVYSYAPSNDALLAEILKYFPIDDDTEHPITVMTPDRGYSHEPEIWADYLKVLSQRTDRKAVELHAIPRADFYRRARGAYATIQTSDPRLYADIIVTKGVVVVEQGPAGP